MNSPTKQKLFEYLSSFISAPRKQKLIDVVQHRTRHVTVAFERVNNEHNRSAAIRSCEIFGVQDVHLIRGKRREENRSSVNRGGARWLSHHYYESTTDCLASLRANGYAIATTGVNPNATPLYNLPLDKKIAIFFGNEKDGVTVNLQESSDYIVTIPMYGLTESFNVSVSVALCLHHIIQSLNASSINWRLSTDEQLTVLIEWLVDTNSAGTGLVDRFFTEHPDLLRG